MMKPHLADTLARLRVCAAAQLAPEADLIRDTIGILEGIVDCQMLRAARDRCIVRASMLLPNGSLWDSARRLAIEARVVNRCWHRERLHAPVPWTLRGELLRAKLCAELPASTRQFFRVLKDTRCAGVFDTRVLAMSAKRDR